MLLRKECSRCKEYKPLEMFYDSKARCKECVKAKQRAYNVSHKLEQAISNKAYRATHKEQMARSDFERYWNDPVAARAAASQRYHDNIDSAKAVQREYRQNNPEIFRERNRRRRATLKGLSEHFTESEWAGLLESYGEICMNPKCRSTKNLTRDHIIPLVSGGSDTIENIQILCGLCNSHKGITSVNYKILHYYKGSVSILV